MIPRTRLSREILHCSSENEAAHVNRLGRRDEQHEADFAVRPMAGASGARRRQAERAGATAVAADRMAGGRRRTGSLLAGHAAGLYLARAHGRSGRQAKFRWRIERDYLELKRSSKQARGRPRSL
jgi:hypothetical protein